MGQCENCCIRDLKANKDFLVPIDYEKLNFDFSDNNFQIKVIFLQTRIKRFLKRKRNAKLKIKNDIFVNGKTPNFKEKNNFVINSCNNLKNLKSVTPKSSEQNENENLIIPRVIPDFVRSKTMFTEDPFREGIRHINTNNQTDPRFAKNKVRKYFPIITHGSSKYEGEWLNGKRDGVGILTYQNVSKYVGYFSKNQVEGFGILYQEEGDTYIGYWKNCMTNGLGIYKTTKDAVYMGNWLNDKQDGFGLEKWPQGANYMGEYKNGNKEGIGLIYFFTNGVYEGEFSGGCITGLGTFVFKDGRKYEGMWKNNKMHGYGVISWPDLKMFEGEFFEDKKQGFGIYYSVKKIYIGIWKNSCLEGEVIIVEKNRIKKEIWEKGKVVKNLPDNYKIFYEKYLDEILNFRNNFIKN